MNYKILKQTDKAFEIKHPDGSTFTVPKKGISKAMMDKIEKMPGFADGGPVEYPADPKIPQNFNPRAGESVVNAAKVFKRALTPKTDSAQNEYPLETKIPLETFNPNAGAELMRGVAESLGVGGYRQQEGVEPSPISPIDFITPGMIAAPARALGRGAAAIGREVIEAAPRIIANETGAVGGLTSAPRMVMPGMYSKVEQSITEKMGGAATPQQIMGILREAKPEEVEYLKIPQFLEGKTKVTKDEMLGHIRENLPKIEQKSGDENFSQYTLPGGEEYKEKLYQIEPQEMVEINKKRNAIAQKYGAQIENAWGEYKAAESNIGSKDGYDYYRAKARELDLLQKEQNRELNQLEETLPKPYKSSHFTQPNIFAHSRTKTRTGPNGEKHLFAEEIQSDWHQTGRDKGYKTLTKEQTDQEIKKVLDRNNANSFLELSQKAPQEYAKIVELAKSAESGVPNAPMKKTWHEFVSKRLLHDAAESGADNLSWTTGKTQADRYNLAKHIKKIEYIKDPTRPESIASEFRAFDHSGKLVMRQNGLTDEQLSDYVGKETAKKLLKQPTVEYGSKTGTLQTLENENLHVGGEGMKGFYDKIIPEYMSKISKKYGVKPEMIEMPISKFPKPQDFEIKFFPTQGYAVTDASGNKVTGFSKEYWQAQEAKDKLLFKPMQIQEKVWNLKITPEMRKDILKKGFPLFTGAAAIGAQKSEAKEQKGFYNGGKVGTDMSYKIIKDSEDHYQVMHPDGSRFTVPKKGISKQMHEKIMGMPKFYDGGMPADIVPSEPDATSSEMYAEEPNKTTIPKQSFEFAPNAPEMEPQENAPPVAQAQAAPMPQKSDYDVMFEKMGGRLAAPIQNVSDAQRQYDMRVALAQNEADVRQQEMNDYIKSADKEAMDFSEKNRIDPKRYWSKMDTGNKIQAALAIALGGIGAGLMGGGKNYALEIINKAIDQDIDAQKEDRNSLYNVMLNKHKRHETALSVAKADALQKVQNALSAFNVQTKSAEAQQAGAKLLNDLDVQKVAYKDYFQKKNASDFLTKQAANGANLNPNEIELLPKDTRERFINGIGLASKPESAVKIRDTKASADDINQIIDQMINIRKQVGRELLPSVASQKADSLGKVLIGKLREPILGPGTMQQAEYERLQQMIPIVTNAATLEDNVFARLNTIRDIVNSNLDNKIKAEGIGLKPRPSAEIKVPGTQQGLILNK